MGRNFGKSMRVKKNKVNFGTSDSEIDNSDTMSVSSRISGLKSTFSR
jgi:hypothetical protein